MELRIILGILFRRKWIIIQGFLVIFLTAVIGCFAIPTVYEASAVMLVKGSSSTRSMLRSLGFEDGASSVADISGTTHAELVTSYTLIQRVIDTLQLRGRDKELLEPKDVLEPTIGLSLLLPDPYLSAAQSENSDNVITITARAENPEKTAMLANTLANFYIEDNIRHLRGEYHQARLFVQGKIDAARRNYLAVLTELNDLKFSNKSLDITQETNNAVDRLAELMSNRETIVINLAQNKARLKTLQEQLKRQGGTAVSSAAISENQVISGLKNTLRDLELDLAAALEEKRESHPQVKALRNQIATLKKALEKELWMYRKTSVDLESLERDIAALEANLETLNAQIARHESRIEYYLNVAKDQTALSARREAAQDRYTQLLDYLTLLGVTETLDIGNIRLMKPATPPKEDDEERPNKVIYILLGGFLGVSFGLFLGLLVEYLDETVRIPDHVASLGAAFIGAVPKVGRMTPKLVDKHKKPGPYTEAWRWIGRTLEHESKSKLEGALLVASYGVGEGKSAAAANLGLILASSGRSVVIVDLNLYRPSIHKLFDCANNIGVTSVIKGEVELIDSVYWTGVHGLDVIPSGPSVPIPGALIDSEGLGYMIDELTRRYDTVILDTPAEKSCRDASILASFAKTRVLIAAAGKTDRTDLSTLLAQWKKMDMPVTGIIINKQKPEPRFV